MVRLPLVVREDGGGVRRHQKIKWWTLDVKVFKIFENTGPIASYLTFAVTKHSFMGGSPGELNEELVSQEKQKKGWGMICYVGEETEELENDL